MHALAAAPGTHAHACTAHHTPFSLALQDGALQLLESLEPRHGIRPQARHINWVVAAEAAAGNLADARGLVDAAGARGWGRNAGSFNALLAGLVTLLGAGEDDEITNE